MNTDQEEAIKMLGIFEFGKAIGRLEGYLKKEREIKELIESHKKATIVTKKNKK